MSSIRNRYQDDENDDQGLFTNRSTMMANFEEWIKMATDNKINSKNSWNFALIDYFHDLNVLRDSENNINFQKASATLDGCVKIYSSRVDSVTTETGKLLSGLAQKKKDDKIGSSNGQDRNDGSDEHENGAEDGVYIDPATGLPVASDTDAQAKRRVYNRVLETTLVDFDSIKLKELDKELNIDPLFKKALVDFDEGGAKSLLLNTLNTDCSARVVFDTAFNDEGVAATLDDLSDKGKEEKEAPENEAEKLINSEMADTSETLNSEKCDDSESTIIIEDEILSLGIDFIKFDEISRCEISSSIQQLRNVVEDISKAKNFIDTVNNKFDNFLSEQELQDVVPEAGLDDINSDNGVLQDEYSYISQEEDKNEENTESPKEDVNNARGLMENIETSNTNENAGRMENLFEIDLMSYFDESLKRNWRGREHWKVRNLKRSNLFGSGPNETNKLNNPQNESNDDNEKSKNETAAKKKKKQTEIDFFAIDDHLEETIFAPKKRANIDLPLKARTDDSHHLLPPDYQFSTKKITRLFIKPTQSMNLFTSRRNLEPVRMQNEKVTHTTPKNNNEGIAIADEQFWAQNYERKEREEEEEKNEPDEDIKNGIINNPFADDDVDVDFNQAFEDDTVDSSPNEEPGKLPIDDSKVSYSRVSKKVDVRKLKHNLWKSIKVLVGRDAIDNNRPHNDNQDLTIKIRLTDIAGEISKLYPDEALTDISTSFCFICLLHLANEYGLHITNTENFEDLIVAYNKTIND